MTRILREPDEAVTRVAAVLEQYEKAHPGSEAFVYRYNPASIRVKVVDGRFHGWSKGQRHDYVKQYLDRLPEDVGSEISILLCLEPGETPLINLEFNDPIPSEL